MPLFLETSDLICQAGDTCNKNHGVVRAGREFVCRTKLLDLGGESKPRSQF